MLKIRSTPTEAEQTGYGNSQLTEPERAEFHNPAIPNMVRECVQENSLENISPDPMQSTLPRSDTYPQASSFDSKSEEREEIAEPLHTNGPAPVWVQHRQNATWEPATVVSQCTTNSYWIMQENSTEQAKVYRRTRSMLNRQCT